MEHNMKLIKSTASRGVTLVEIAIVLVIIGLLLGGILKGQELINNAKIRSIANQQQSVKIAWFAFLDRYQALPGDFINDQLFIPGAGPPIDVSSGVNLQTSTGDGYFHGPESPRVFQNLAGAGYLRCPHCTETQYFLPTAFNSPGNSYGGIMSIWMSAHGMSLGGIAFGDIGHKLQIHTGTRIPSNILSEIDRKIDDGIANMGDFVMNEYDPQNGPLQIPLQIGGGIGIGVGLCTTESINAHVPGKLDSNVPTYWRHAQAQPPVEQNCGASIII